MEVVRKARGSKATFSTAEIARQQAETAELIRIPREEDRINETVSRPRHIPYGLFASANQ
jgi:hypothetical protein